MPEQLQFVDLFLLISQWLMVVYLFYAMRRHERLLLEQGENTGQAFP